MSILFGWLDPEVLPGMIPLQGKPTRFSAQDGLVGNDFHLLQKTIDGSLYVSSTTATFHFTGTGWEEIDFLPKDQQNWDVFRVQFAPYGIPWMTGLFLPTWMAGSEVYRYDGAAWEKMIHGYPNVRISFDKSGKIAWVLSDSEGLYRFDGNAWKEFSVPFLGKMGIWVYDFVVDAQGNVWMTSGGTGKNFSLHHFDGSQWTEVNPDPGCEMGYLGRVWADPEAGIWYPVGTYGVSSTVEVIHLVDGKQVFREILPLEDFSVDSLTSLALGQDGSVWMSSNGYSRWGPSAQPGLLHFANGKWTRISLPADIPGEWNTSCVVDGEGRVVFSSDGKVIRWENDAWKPLPVDDRRESLDGLVGDPSGMLWAKTDKEVFFYQDGQWVSTFLAPGNQHISHLFVDSKQTVWIASYTAEKVWQMVQQTVQEQPVPGEKGTERVIGFGEDVAGTVYLATDHGIFRMNEGTWQEIATFHQRLQAFQIINDQIWIARDEGIRSTGIYWYDGQHWQPIQGVEIAQDEEIHAIHSTDGGATIWFSVGFGRPNRGVIRYITATGDSTRWTVEDGLAGNTVMSLCQEPSGTIWFGTNAGISRYQP